MKKSWSRSINQQNMLCRWEQLNQIIVTQQSHQIITAGQVDHYFAIREQISQISHKVTSEMAIVDKLNSEQTDIIETILTRCRTSLLNFRAIIETLCLKIQEYNPYDHLFSQCRTQAELVMNEWRSMEEVKICKNVLFRKDLKQQSDAKTEANQKPRKSSIKVPVGMCKSVKSKKDFTIEDYQYKLTLRDQFFKIRQYVNTVLAPMLEYSEGGQIPKKIAFNCYLRYLQQRKMKIQIEFFSRIQMQLTNQIKECFPNVKHAKKNYYGLRFKKEHQLQMGLTDRQPPVSQEEMEFNDDFDDPIDELILEKRNDDIKKDGSVVNHRLFD